MERTQHTVQLCGETIELEYAWGKIHRLGHKPDGPYNGTIIFFKNWPIGDVAEVEKVLPNKNVVRTLSAAAYNPYTKASHPMKYFYSLDQAVKWIVEEIGLEYFKKDSGHGTSGAAGTPIFN